MHARQEMNMEHSLNLICSTSLPGGNQVDGLPPASSFEQCEHSVPMRSWFDVLALSKNILSDGWLSLDI